MNDVKIQLNSLEALERLIGGDSALEVEIRNSVVQNFATKHLKPLANSEPLKDIFNQIKAEILRQITKQCEKEICTIKESAYYGYQKCNIELNPTITSKIKEAIQTLFDSTVKQTINYAIEKYLDKEYLEQEINRRFEYYTKDVIDRKVREKIEELKRSL